MSTQPQTAEIEVKYVNPPKAGKQSGTIKTADGQLYGVWPDKLGLFQPGRRYRVEYVERPYKGKQYRSITKRLADTAPETSFSPVARQAMSEEHWVAHLMAACLQSQLIELNDRDLNRGAKLFQQMYRDLFARH